MTNKEAINYLKETEGYTFSGIDNPKHNEAINLAIKALEEKEEMESAIDWWRKKTEAEAEIRKMKTTGEYNDFLIAAGPRRSGKTTEIIKEVCKINREAGRNVAVIICLGSADAHSIFAQANALGFSDMPYPITITEILCDYGRGWGHHYKYGFVNDLDRIAQDLISPLCLHLRGFCFTLPEQRKED